MILHQINHQNKSPNKSPNKSHKSSKMHEGTNIKKNDIMYQDNLVYIKARC